MNSVTRTAFQGKPALVTGATSNLGRADHKRAQWKAAIVTFASRGYEGTSTDDLRHAMQIGRQSLYDTFGDKRALYLTALKKYGTDSVNEVGSRRSTARLRPWPASKRSSSVSPRIRAGLARHLASA